MKPSDSSPPSSSQLDGLATKLASADFRRWPLEALLDDPAPRDAYEGSEEATEMAMRHYRVKDFAAFYIARILQVDLPWEQSVARRDETIAKLRTQIH